MYKRGTFMAMMRAVQRGLNAYIEFQARKTGAAATPRFFFTTDTD